MKKVYISGPISGRKREEYMAAFAKAEELLRDNGYEAINPTLFLVCRWPWIYRLLGYHLTLLYDLWRLHQCDMIYKMPGWQESHGSNIESCWAYHTGMWLIPKKQRDRIDKALEAFIMKGGKP